MTGARRVVVRVGPEAGGTRLDRFLATIPELPTRSQAKRLVDAGHVLVDGVARKASFPLSVGSCVEIRLDPLPSGVVVEAEDLPLSILLDDPDVLAIDKPPGMAAHPAPGARRGTVVNAVLHHVAGVRAIGDPERPGIVHRLDKDTSGVMLIARTPDAMASLGRQFHDRCVRKTYVAVVHGRMPSDRGRIDQAIGRHPTERKRMSVRTRRGRRAITNYEVAERFAEATLVVLRPETGRTHQLRVHLAAMGHPIVGDVVYGGRRNRSRADEGIGRHALHAAELVFAHPRTGAPVQVTAPWPDDLRALIERLRQRADTARKSDH